MLQDAREGNGFEAPECIMPGESVASCGRAADAAEKSSEGAFASQGGMAFFAEGLDGCDVLRRDFWNEGRWQGLGCVTLTRSAMTAWFFENFAEVGQ